MMAIRKVSIRGLARTADPKSHEAMFHQVPVPMAHSKSGGHIFLATSLRLVKFSMRPGMVNPTWAPA